MPGEGGGPAGGDRRAPPSRTRLDDSGEGFINLGVAHGVPGAIAMLAGARAAGIAESRPLLDDAVAWLLAQKLPAGAGSRFATEVWLDGDGAPQPSSLAWCYGDLGIAATLLAAGRTVGESGWEREALKIARAAAARPPAREKECVDACLCHGAAGVGHLFNRLHQATGEPVFAAAARTWLLEALDRRQPGAPFGGFRTQAMGPEGVKGWRDEPGFLTGAAGIGLCLLAAATALEPAWDRILLITSPAP